MFFRVVLLACGDCMISLSVVMLKIVIKTTSEKSQKMTTKLCILIGMYCLIRGMYCMDIFDNVPDSKVHGANMGPIWGRQDPGGPHVGPVNFAIWGVWHAQMFFFRM